MSARLLLLGAPGSGKRTQGVRLAARFGVPHISTGELLRGHVRRGSDLGRVAEPYMRRGDLVPDDVIISMVLDRLTRPDPADGYVLDGFPRTVPQAEAAYELARRLGLMLTAVIVLDLTHDELFRRLGERAGHEGRADDAGDTVRHRIAVYEAKTLPLLDYYTGRGILVRVSAIGPVDAVTARILAAFQPVVS